MKASIHLLALISIFSIASCTQSQPVLSEMELKANADRAEDRIERQAKIVKTGEDAPCDYLIELDSGDMLEPAMLVKAFKKDGLAVKLKFAPLRQQSSCGRTIPVELLTIEAVQ